MKTKVSLQFTVDVESDKEFEPGMPFAEIVEYVGDLAVDEVKRRLADRPHFGTIRDYSVTKVNIDWEAK